MEGILSFLKDLLPVWALLLVAGFGYLLVLIRRASDRFLEIAAKQADYLKDRIDVVDKSTGIFTSTIEQQEKEITRLTEAVGRLGAQVQNSRETDARLSVQELQVLASSIDQLSTGQEELRRLIAGPRQVHSDHADQPPPTSEWRLLRTAIDTALPKAIRARDLSVYSISMSPLEGANRLLDILRADGYAASLYEPERKSVPSDSEGIWLGAAVPPSIAVDVITKARKVWPFMKYVHLSSDSGGPDETHTSIYLGGATSSATGFLKCLP